jgi:hypothetical protein
MVPLALMESAHFHLFTSAASRAGFAHRFGKCRSDRFAIISETALRNLGEYRTCPVFCSLLERIFRPPSQ